MPAHENLDDLDAEPHATVFPDSEPKTVRLALETGESMPEHSHPGRQVLFYLLEGAVELGVGETTYDLAPNDIVRFDGDQEIAPTATQESTALVVLAPVATE